MNLSREEVQVLHRVSQAGALSTQLYDHGVFSEPAFVLYGVLERLVIRKQLAYLGRTGDDRNATYTYALPSAAPAADAVDLIRTAA
jgi:hypothetical protein